MSSYSYRHGAVTFAFQSGVPAKFIQAQGDWTSDAYTKYLPFSLDDKVLVSGKMASFDVTMQKLTS